MLVITQQATKKAGDVYLSTAEGRRGIIVPSTSSYKHYKSKPVGLEKEHMKLVS